MAARKTKKDESASDDDTVGVALSSIESEDLVEEEKASEQSKESAVAPVSETVDRHRGQGGKFILKNGVRTKIEENS